MDIDVKTNIFEDTNPLLDAGPDPEGQVDQASDAPVEKVDQKASELPWKRESWWTLFTYWLDEYLWRRRYWNKLRPGDHQ